MSQARAFLIFHVLLLLQLGWWIRRLSTCRALLFDSCLADVLFVCPPCRSDVVEHVFLCVLWGRCYFWCLIQLCDFLIFLFVCIGGGIVPLFLFWAKSLYLCKLFVYLVFGIVRIQGLLVCLSRGGWPFGFVQLEFSCSSKSSRLIWGPVGVSQWLEWTHCCNTGIFLDLVCMGVWLLCCFSGVWLLLFPVSAIFSMSMLFDFVFIQISLLRDASSPEGFFLWNVLGFRWFTWFQLSRIFWI